MSYNFADVPGIVDEIAFDHYRHGSFCDRSNPKKNLVGKIRKLKEGEHSPLLYKVEIDF